MKIQDLRESHRANKFMRGGCYAFALWLNSKTKLPLYGLYDNEGNMHHALVYDTANEVAYDARGEVSKDKILNFQGRSCAGTILKPTTRPEVKEYALKMEPISSSQIRGFAVNHYGLNKRFKF